MTTWFAKLPDTMKAWVALVGALMGAFSGGMFLSGYSSLPAEHEEFRAQIQELQGRMTANEEGDRALRVEVRFLSCAEVARQQQRDDPNCLRAYFEARQDTTP